MIDMPDSRKRSAEPRDGSPEAAARRPLQGDNIAGKSIECIFRFQRNGLAAALTSQ